MADKLILFDLDGTLVDSQDLIVEAQRRAFAALDIRPPSRAASLSIVGLSLREAFTALAGAEGPVESLSLAYREAWTQIRAAPDFAEPLFPGAREIIAALAGMEGVTLGIATGKARRGVDHLFAHTGWQSSFKTVQTADGHPSKPAPDMILAAMAEAGARARRNLYDRRHELRHADGGQCGRSRDRRRLGLSQRGRADPLGGRTRRCGFRRIAASHRA